MLARPAAERDAVLRTILLRGIEIGALQAGARLENINMELLR